MNVLLDDIHPSRLNPRQVKEDYNLRSLAESIRTVGIIEPLVVRKSREGLELITGERRWHAARLAGLEEVPVVVRDQVGDREALELMLIENLQREDLNPLEEAEGYRRMISEFGYVQRQLARAVGKSQGTISRTLSLLDLPEDVRQKIRSGQLSMSHGFRLAEKRLPVAEISRLATEAVTTGQSVHHLEDELLHIRKRPYAKRSSPLGRQRIRPTEVKALRAFMEAAREWVNAEEDHQACGCDKCQQLKQAFDAVRGML